MCQIIEGYSNQSNYIANNRYNIDPVYILYPWNVTNVDYLKLNQLNTTRPFCFWKEVYDFYCTYSYNTM